MRKSPFIFFVILAASTVQSQDYDVIFGSSTLINGKVRLGDQKAYVIQQLGTPDTQYPETFNEYWNENVAESYYGPNKVPFFSGKLDQFVLVDNRFYLKIGDVVLRVGDSASILAGSFPKSWASRRPVEGNNGVTYTNLEFGGHQNGQLIIYDEWIEIEWNSLGVITRIRHFVPN